MRKTTALTLLLALLACAGCRAPRSGFQPTPTDKAVALAAVLESAVQAADEETRATFAKFYLLPAGEPTPERAALIEAVADWPKSRRDAALRWVKANATWTTQLHALALESFGEDFAPLAWGPTMSQFDPSIFSRRKGLASLLSEAWQDPAIRLLASRVAESREPFTAEGVQERRERLVSYLRLEDEFPPFSALGAPLLQRGNGVNAYLPDGSILFVVGPTSSAGDASMILFHEMAHQPVNALMRSPEVSHALATSRCFFDRHGGQLGYSDWPPLFGEALVRTISYRLQGVRYDTGFWEDELVPMLEAWEQQPDVPFSSAMVSMLAALTERHCV